MNGYHRSLLMFFIGCGIAAGIIFIGGYLFGRSKPPELKTILMEEKADREYIERYKVAGEDRYQYVLHKEYVLAAEFLTDGWTYEEGE